jgi:curved DNA-binding protein CbpA
MDHYDTLGVPHDADDAAIKKGFRKAASAAHPDREGGDPAAMQRVNRAYQVLSDPNRRAQYDASGDDTEQKPEVDQARDMALEVLKAAMQQEGDVIRFARGLLVEHRAKMVAAVRDAALRVAKLQQRRGRIKTRDGATNLAHLLIDEAIGQLNAGIAKAEEQQRLVPKALILIDAHESEEQEEIRPHMQFFRSQGFTSATGAW